MKGEARGQDGKGEEEMGGEDTATLIPAKGPQLLALRRHIHFNDFYGPKDNLEPGAWSLGEEQWGHHTK